MTRALFVRPNQKPSLSRRFEGMFDANSLLWTFCKSPKDLALYRFTTSDVNKTSAEVFIPSALRRFINADALSLTMFTLMPLLSVNDL